MALNIPQSILQLARSLYVRPETYGPTYVHINVTLMCVRITIFAVEMSRAWLIAVAMRSSEILEFSFPIALVSRLSSGDSLPWVVRGVRGVYCEFSWLAFKPAVGTRTWDPVEASSEFQLISRGAESP